MNTNTKTALQQAKAYLDAATSPADRQLRKRDLHGMLYSSGPLKLNSFTNVRKHTNQRSKS